MKKLAPEIARARNAILIAYIANGIALGSFLSRIPDYKSILGITDGRLGLSLVFGSMGVVISLGQAGRMSAKFGSKPVIVWSTFGVGITIPWIGILTNPWVLSASLFVWGCTLGFQDISLSSHGVALENESGRKLLSTLHAMYSLGSIIGVASGGVFAQLKIVPIIHLGIVGTLLFLITFVIIPLLRPADFDKHVFESRHKQGRRPQIFWVVGLLGVCAAISEGTASDWGGVLARDTFGASPFVSSLPYALFCVLMVIGRLNGDRLSERYGTQRILIVGGLIAGTGLTTGMLMNNLAGVFIGWFFVGIGVSAVIPLLMSLAGEIARERFAGSIAPSEAVAMITGVSYFAFIAAPPMLGFLSDHITLRLAILVPAGLAFAMAIGASLAPIKTKNNLSH